MVTISRSTAVIAILIAAGIIAVTFIIFAHIPGDSEARGAMKGNDTITLPLPKVTGSISVEEALASRRSVRDYTASPLDIAELSQLLWAAQGITGPSGFRTAPSAGALYPIELYITCGNVTGLLPGVYRYIPGSHALETVINRDMRSDLYRAALRQAAIRDAAAVIIIAADYHRTTEKYGDRGIRYVHMEVGHVSENIYLQAYALRIGTVAIGAFDDENVKIVLGMPKNQTPLYLMPVGKVSSLSF